MVDRVLAEQKLSVFAEIPGVLLVFTDNLPRHLPALRSGQ
jgi:hypothetical protein